MATRTISASSRKRTSKAAEPAEATAEVEQDEVVADDQTEPTDAEVEQEDGGVPVEAPSEHPHETGRLPYMIESAELECVKGDVRIRLDIVRGKSHFRLYHSPSQLSDLIRVSDLKNDDATLSDLRGHAVMVSFGESGYPTMLSGIYDESELLWLA